MKKMFVFLLLFFISSFASAELQIHCKGKVKIFSNVDGKDRKFDGELAWDLEGGDNNYFSVSGYYLVQGESYSIERTIRATVSLISEIQGFYEITPIKTIIQQMDELPLSLEDTFLFKKPRVFRIKKTLTNSYLVSNAYSPIFICHEI